MATLISTNVTGTLDILNSTSNIKLLRLSHPTSPTTDGGFLGFNSDGTTDNMVVTLGVQYSSNYYNVINIKRDTRNVGIGSTNPQRTLDLSESGQITFGDQVSSGTSDNKQGIYWHNGDSYGIFRTSGSWSAPNYQQLILKWATGIILNPGGGTYGKSHVGVVGGVSIGDSYFDSEYNNGLIVQGNVGIGTTDPSSVSQSPKLAVVHSGAGIATFDATGTNGGYITITDSNTPLVYLGSSAQIISSGGTTTDAALRSQGELILATGGDNERMRIDSSGNVGIGTTDPNNPLHIQHNSALTTDQALFIHNTNSGAKDAGIKFSDNSTALQNGIFYYTHLDTASNGTQNSFHFNSDQTNLAVIVDQTNGNSGYYIGESSPVVAIRGSGDSFFNGQRCYKIKHYICKTHGHRRLESNWSLLRF
jgi:hypothetical protein